MFLSPRAQEMSTGPWDFAAELRGLTSVNAAQKGQPGSVPTQVTTCSDQHHEGPHSEAQTPKGHPPEGALSLQHDTGWCSQNHWFLSSLQSPQS